MIIFQINRSEKVILLICFLLLICLIYGYIYCVQGNACRHNLDSLNVSLFRYWMKHSHLPEIGIHSYSDLISCPNPKAAWSASERDFFVKNIEYCNINAFSLLHIANMLDMISIRLMATLSVDITEYVFFSCRISKAIMRKAKTPYLSNYYLHCGLFIGNSKFEAHSCFPVIPKIKRNLIFSHDGANNKQKSRG